ncbi:helix-turn-helix domain-containing protein [Amycolatopsis vancoresmycina]|uniref:helix-turn-helix domain-containing protein n=1 Tax=Amycolatopsis vancoresmycina TaxID=208444 RepID=UPI000A640C73|nr:helix-turn-helix transcriptional regulator [Amycolatopsis vancoresmycina]
METTDAQRNITRNVRILMAARDMFSQQELADSLGWTSAKMTKTLKGDRRWSVEDLYEIGRIFGISAGALLGSTAEVVAAAGPTVATPVNGSVTSR